VPTPARVVADFQETATTGGVYAPRVIRTVGGDTIAYIRSELIRVYEWSTWGGLTAIWTQLTSNGLCVIDWDNSGPESPTRELAVGLVEFGHTAKRIRCLVEAYEDAGGPGRIRRPEDFTMAIAQLRHIGEWTRSHLNESVGSSICRPTSQARRDHGVCQCSLRTRCWLTLS
jgi:hypothetical protein